MNQITILLAGNQNKKRTRRVAKRLKSEARKHRTILLMTCLHVAVRLTCLFVSLRVLFICPDQKFAWLFLIATVLDIAPQSGRKNLAKIKRILKAIADLLK